MATWNKKHPEIYSLFHGLWTKAVGAPGYDKEQWLKFEKGLAMALKIEPESELPWMVQAREAGWVPANDAYQQVVTMAAQAVKGQRQGPENITLFEVSEVLSLVYGKPFETIMADLLKVSLPTGVG